MPLITTLNNQNNTLHDQKMLKNNEKVYVTKPKNHRKKCQKLAKIIKIRTFGLKKALKIAKKRQKMAKKRYFWPECCPIFPYDRFNLTLQFSKNTKINDLWQNPPSFFTKTTKFKYNITPFLYGETKGKLVNFPFLLKNGAWAYNALLFKRNKKWSKPPFLYGELKENLETRKNFAFFLTPGFLPRLLVKIQQNWKKMKNEKKGGS